MTRRLYKYSAWLFIIFIIVGLACMGWVVHPVAEDLNTYWSNPELLLPLGEPIPPFSSLVDNMVDSYMHDNGRFVNNSDILLTALCPKWSWAVINIFFYSALLSLICKIVGMASGGMRQETRGRRREIFGGIAPGILFLAGIMTLLFLPWHDYLFVQRYTTPYIWGAVWMLFTAYGFLKLLSGRKPGAFETVMLCVVAFICGGWHEGFSISLLCGIIPLWIISGRECRRRMAVALLFLIAGTALNMFAPGQFSRIDGMGLILHPFNWFQPTTLTEGVWLWPHVIPLFLYLATILLLLILNRKSVSARIKAGVAEFKSHSRVTLTPFVRLNILCVCVVIAILCLQLLVVMPRVSTPGGVFSVIGLLSVAVSYFPKIKNRVVRRITAVALVALALLLSVNMCGNIAMQTQLSDDHKEIERLLAESRDGVVFYDPVKWPHVNHYPWQLTVNHYYFDYVPLHFALVHPSNKRRLPLRLIPTSLERLPGSLEVNGITFIGGEIVSDREPEYTDSSDTGRVEIFPGEYPYMKINAVVKTLSGDEEIRFYEVIPFTTSKGTADERQLYYFRQQWSEMSDISDPVVELLSIAPPKYW